MEPGTDLSLIRGQAGQPVSRRRTVRTAIKHKGLVHITKLNQTMGGRLDEHQGSPTMQGPKERW